MSGFTRLLRQKYNPPAPTVQPFTGKTILVTGTTSGLGLEAAKKLAVLNPSRLIITARTEEKGTATKRLIQEHVEADARTHGKKIVPDTEITVLALDMSSLAGVETFVSALESYLGQRGAHLDAAILNAGTSQRLFALSPDGYEQTIQVNVVSTVFLAKRLLPLLLAAAAVNPKGEPSHLTFVSSGLANVVQPDSMSQFMASTTPLKDLSLETNFPPGTFGGQKQYGRSKLMLEYAMRHMAAAAAAQSSSVSNNGRQTTKVIINSTCPGMCVSDLGRQYADSLLFQILVWILFTLFARSASQGANIYISALTRDETSHAVMWKDDRNYEAGPMLTSDEGKAFGDKVWRELDEITNR